MKVYFFILVLFVCSFSNAQCLELRQFKKQIKSNSIFVVSNTQLAFKNIQNASFSTQSNQVIEMINEALYLSEEAEDVSNSMGRELEEVRNTFDECGFYLPLDELEVLEQSAILAGEFLRFAHIEMSKINEHTSDKKKNKIVSSILAHLTKVMQEHEIFSELVYH